MSTLRVVERVDEPALICKKCDRCVIGGTLPGRLTLCGGCANNDARARTNRYQKRTRWARRRDHFLDYYLPLALRWCGFLVLIGTAAYLLAQGLGIVR